MNRLRRQQVKIAIKNRQLSVPLSARCRAYRTKIDDLTNAVAHAIVALDDWGSISAADWCDEAQVRNARQRVYANGSSWYIATAVAICRDAIATRNT